MKKALILGLGISGKSAAQYLVKKGYQVTGVDDRQTEQIPGIECASTKTLTSLCHFDLFVPSPGVPRTHPLWLIAMKEGIPIAGEIELAMQVIKQPCIGVTGSNGKTTVVKMIEHCLNTLGKKARALGNVGDPLLAYLEHPNHEEILIVELSSFQLETLKTPALNVGLILNITENHLDRYADFMEYAATKAHMQHCIKPGGILGVHRSVIQGFSHLFDQKPRDFCLSPRDVSYEEDNQAAALFAVQYFEIPSEAFFSALRTFSKPKHRLEFIAQVNDVIYYNDSKATSPAAVDVALEFLKGKRVILLAGGVDKGLSFAPLTRHRETIVDLIVFGECGHKIAAILDRQIPRFVAPSVAAAVAQAAQIAKKGEVVLFSPGGTSFDAFKDYGERGEEFRRCVMNLRRESL